MLGKIKILTLGLSGFITFLMEIYIPVAGGGASLIFVLSKPILLVLGFIFSLCYYLLLKRNSTVLVRVLFYSAFMVIQILLALAFFPYQ